MFNSVSSNNTVYETKKKNLFNNYAPVDHFLLLLLKFTNKRF